MRNLRVLCACVVAGFGLAACNLRQPPVQGNVQSTLQSPVRVLLQTELSGKAEVPQTNSAGTGSATAILNAATRELSWSVTYEGLSGSVISAHLHGPADPGTNAMARIDIGKDGLASPIRGSAKVTDQQMQQILAGKWYVNLHTERNLAGEIRGQIRPALQ